MDSFVPKKKIGRNEKSAAEILAPVALVKPVNPSHQRAPFGYDPLWVYKKFTRFQDVNTIVYILDMLRTHAIRCTA
mgnify:CR=1 FL=1